MRSGIPVLQAEHLCFFPKNKCQSALPNISWCMNFKPLLHCEMNPNHKIFLFEATDMCKRKSSPVAECSGFVC